MLLHNLFETKSISEADTASVNWHSEPEQQRMDATRQGRLNREREPGGSDTIDDQLRARNDQLAQYTQTGKFWIKQKDTQQHISDEYVGKAAANAAAQNLLKQQPELRGNIVITAYGPGETSGVAEGRLDNPGAEDSPVAQAIIRRILLQRTDLLAKHGPERVGAAVDEVADFVGDVDEIGSSDVSGWIRHVEQMLGNMDQGVAENYPKQQDLSGISTEKLKAYLAKQGQQQSPGEGRQVKRVRAELQRRSQGVAEGSSKAMAQAASRLTDPKDGSTAKLRAAGDKRREDDLKSRDIAKKNEAAYDRDDYYNARQGRDYGKGLTATDQKQGGGSKTQRDDIFKGQSNRLPADPFARTTGAVPTASTGRIHSTAGPDEMDEGEKIGNMDADAFDNAMARLKQLAGAGPMKTVYDPARRVYKNVPTAVQPAQQLKK